MTRKILNFLLNFFIFHYCNETSKYNLSYKQDMLIL